MQKEDGVKNIHEAAAQLPSSSVDTSLIDDITVLLESSFTLQSTKYLEKKTCFVFHYVRLSNLNTLYPFMVTVVKRIGHGIYSGYDTSTYCLVKTEKCMAPGIRYLVYGKVRKTQLYIIHADKVEPVDYKKLCYNVF